VNEWSAQILWSKSASGGESSMCTALLRPSPFPVPQHNFKLIKKNTLVAPSLCVSKRWAVADGNNYEARPPRCPTIGRRTTIIGARSVSCVRRRAKDGFVGPTVRRFCDRVGRQPWWRWEGIPRQSGILVACGNLEYRRHGLCMPRMEKNRFTKNASRFSISH